VSKYDLTLNALELGSRLGCRLVYSTALFESATVERILGHLHGYLAAVAADPDQPVGAVDFFAPEERRHLLVEWNAPAVPYAPDGDLPALFEAQVDAGPKRPAVVFLGRKLSYADLDQRANRLARHLQGLGVGPEVLVGVHLERSFDLVVALLAVEKAGGAYLPLDPSLPEERLRYLIEDAAAAVLITNGATELFTSRSAAGFADPASTGPLVLNLDEAKKAIAG